VHDSILTEAPYDEVDEVAVVLPKIMTTDIPRITIDIKADVDVLDKWKK
jgi:DNA polymerase I-like protein with 3'-5' exonuclease and polymerase domains